jgi:alpha-tubulin suppressor-like RCC1 family protein
MSLHCSLGSHFAALCAIGKFKQDKKYLVWGEEVEPTVVELPPVSDVRDFALGVAHSLVLLENGSVVALGRNSNGQLGIASKDETRYVYEPTFAHFPASTRIAIVAAGASQSAALTVDGLAYVWGAVSDCLDELSAATDRFVCEPTLVRELSSLVVVNVACGREHVLFVTAAGVVYAAGANENAQCGVVTTTARSGLICLPLERFGGAPVRHVAAGDAHSCALTAIGSVYCWGRNDQRQCARASSVLCAPPSHVALPADVTEIVSVACGAAFTTALDSSRRLWTWGANDVQQLGRALAPDGSPLLGAADGYSGTAFVVRTALVTACHTVLLTSDSEVHQFGHLGSDLPWNRSLRNPNANTHGMISFGLAPDW